MDRGRPADEFWLVACLTFWVLMLWVSLGLFSGECQQKCDIYNYFFLRDPGAGGLLPYPVFALAYFKAIGVLAGGLPAFSIAFGALSFFWLCFSLLLFSRLGIGSAEIVKRSVVLAPVFLLVLGRVEIFCIALTLLSIVLFLEGRRWFSWGFLVFAVFVKIFPVFLIPLYLIAELTGKRRSLARPVFFVLLLAALSLLPVNATSLLYQAGRPLEIESLYSDALLIFGQALHFALPVAYTFGSWNITPPAQFAMLSDLPTFVQLAFTAAISLLYLLDKKRGERLPIYAFLMFCAVVMAGKIFTAQFVLWPLVFGIPLMGDRSLRWLPALLFLLSASTILLYPLLFNLLIADNVYAIAMLTIRNILLVLALSYVALRHSSPSGEIPETSRSAPRHLSGKP